MNKQSSISHPLTLFLPTELRTLLETGWQIMWFHRDSAGYGVRLVQGSVEQVWRFDPKKGHYVEQALQNKKDYILS